MFCNGVQASAGEADKFNGVELFAECVSKDFVAELVDVGWVIEWCILLDTKQISHSIFDVVGVWHASNKDAALFQVCFDFLEDDVRIVQVFDYFCGNNHVIFVVKCPFAV